MTNTALIFLASVGGILLYLSEQADTAFALGVVVLLAAGSATLAAVGLVKSNPVTATWLFAAWRAFPLALILLAGYGSAALALHLPNLIELRAEVANEELGKVASTLIIASINTFLGAIALDAAKDPDSHLWPGTLQRRAWKSAFDGTKEKLPKEPDPETVKAYRALHHAYGEHRTFEGEAEGWNFWDRIQRARIIRRAIADLRARGVDI